MRVGEGEGEWGLMKVGKGGGGAEGRYMYVCMYEWKVQNVEGERLKKGICGEGGREGARERVCVSSSSDAFVRERRWILNLFFF